MPNFLIKCNIINLSYFKLLAFLIKTMALNATVSPLSLALMLSLNT